MPPRRPYVWLVLREKLKWALCWWCLPGGHGVRSTSGGCTSVILRKVDVKSIFKDFQEKKSHYILIKLFLFLIAMRTGFFRYNWASSLETERWASPSPPFFCIILPIFSESQLFLNLLFFELKNLFLKLSLKLSYLLLKACQWISFKSQCVQSSEP